MRAIEFIYEAQRLMELKKLGRAFNHLEDLVFFHGVEGVQEALEHLREVGTQAGAQSIRMKWDGSPQVYWGRETKGGPLILAGHNGWGRGVKTDSPEKLADFLANRSGNPSTPQEKQQRDAFAQEFASWYPDFEAATPDDFVGFVYADGLFFERPALDEQGVYNFCPNPKSKTCYHVRADSQLGERISRANIMVVGHGYFPEFGMPDHAQKPMDDFSMFNNNPSLIVLGPIYNTRPVKVDMRVLDDAENYAQKYQAEIDNFLEGTKGLGDLKEIIYKYVNQTAKSKQLDNLSSNHFYNWLKNSKVSQPKQQRIADLDSEYNSATQHIFELVRKIQDAKDSVIDQVEGEQGDIWDTHGEGRVRYGIDKKFGNVKFVPRRRWTPGG